MMATLSGADADALDAAANELHKAAERLRSGRARVERPLHAAPWNGRGADAFRHEWSTNRRAEILAAASFLDGAVQTLRRNAEEQRRASALGAAFDGPTVCAPSGSDDDDAELERIRELLERLGMPVSQLSEVLELLKKLAGVPGLDFGMTLSTLENMVNIAKAVDMLDKVIDFTKALVDHSHLPPDEMLLAAGVTVAMAAVKAGGAQIAGKFVGGVVSGLLASTAVGAPVAPFAGVLTSKLTSLVVDKGLDYADDQLNISENAVEASLDVYRYLKTHDLGDMAVDIAREGGEVIVDTGKNIYEGGKEWVQDGWDWVTRR